MFVKICGLKTIETVKATVEAGVDAIGFVFAKSPRQINVETAKQLRQHIPEHVEVVGVFLDPTEEEIEAAIVCGLTAIQLHGRTLPLEKFHRFKLPLIEASHTTGADIVLMDAPTPGSGEKLDWIHLERPDQPFWLAGGLTPDNVKDAISHVRPDGVDVSSGVETNGEKDINKIRTFIQRAKEEI